VFWRVFRGAGEDEIGVVKKTIAEKHKTEGEKSLPSLAPSPSPNPRYDNDASVECVASGKAKKEKHRMKKGAPQKNKK
jgi:hypothetical protein